MSSRKRISTSIRTALVAAIAATGAVAGFALGGTACNPYDPDLGDQPFLCGDQDPKCPDGYGELYTATGACVCEKGLEPPDGAAPPDANGDAGTVFTCAADPNESPPNDTTTQATATGITSASPTYIAAGLAICPASDIDYFATPASAGDSLTATIHFDSSRSVLQLGLVSPSGARVANGTVDTAGTGLTLTYAVPASGTYYVLVGAGDGVQNNYSVQISVR